MRLSRRLLAVPVALVMAGSLAACGAGSTPQAVEPTTQTSMVPVPVPVQVDQAGFVLTASNFSDLGTVALAAKSYSFHATVSAAGQSLEMVGDVSGSDVQLSETVPGVETPVEIRVVGGVVYVNLGPGTGNLFWQVDPSSTSELATSFADAVEETSVADSTEALKAAIVSVTPTGAPEAIDGVPTQAYAVVVDTSKLTGPAAEALASAAAAGVPVPTQITYTYWVGDDKLLRKMTTELFGTATEMLFTNWGGAVAIQAPPADQITTVEPAF